MNLCNDFSEEQKIYINSLSNKCGSSKTMHKIRKIIDTGLPENNTQALDKFKEIVRDSLEVSIMFLNIILKLKMKKLNMY